MWSAILPTKGPRLDDPHLFRRDARLDEFAVGGGVYVHRSYPPEYVKFFRGVRRRFIARSWPFFITNMRGKGKGYPLSFMLVHAQHGVYLAQSQFEVIEKMLEEEARKKHLKLFVDQRRPYHFSLHG